MAFPFKDPSKLSDNEWAELIQQYSFVKQLEYKNLEAVFKKSLAEVLSKMLGNE